MSRSISEEYRDPLELIWLEVAARLGWRIERSDSVYASWDGDSVLTLSSSSDFDPDDHLAQLIFHEICHALVQGAGNRRRVDWGLDHTDDARAAVEGHACHRLPRPPQGLLGHTQQALCRTESHLKTRNL